ncbi:GNAT family N-acetyltransferase [Haloparvum sedimenti]|uniref:GNAT family N-acetyltransferase n=1 Tax=Haloparvum sedimenti TaxID=1678448 RepID=UPI00071E8014|nr:GNAT family N-acetyltransferase [Haloparvum sedimenti]
MEFDLLGWPEDEPTLRLDYRAFSYAGKFVMTTTGKAALRTADGSAAAPGWEPDRELPEGMDAAAFDADVAAVIAFDADRTDPEVLRIRYVTVHAALRGQGLGPRLVGELLDPAAERGFDRVRIAVNNPFAYEALYRAGFAFTGKETGLAELVLERPVDAPAADREDAARYRKGLARYRERGGLSDAERSFLRERLGDGGSGGRGAGARPPELRI